MDGVRCFFKFGATVSLHRNEEEVPLECGAWDAGAAGKY